MNTALLTDVLAWLESQQQPLLSMRSHTTVAFGSPHYAESIQSLRTLVGFCHALERHPRIHSARLAQFSISQDGKVHWKFVLTVHTSPQAQAMQLGWEINSQTLETTLMKPPSGYPEEDLQLATAFLKDIQPLMPGIGIQRQVVVGRGVNNVTFTRDMQPEALLARAISPEAWAAYRSAELERSLSRTGTEPARPRF